MSKQVKLDEWFFILSRISDQKKIQAQIRNKNCLEAVQLILNPFTVPGTLQSNMVKYLEINPYYEENIRRMDFYENIVLILFSEFVLNSKYEKLQIVFDYIDTISEIYVNGASIGKSANTFILEWI